MKYMLLIYAKEDVLNDAEREDCYKKSSDLCHQLASKGQFISASPLQSVATATSIKVREGKRLVTDGPFAETKEQLGGILVLEARDMNHAVQLIGQHPALTYGNIFEIRPAADMNEVMRASEQRWRQKTAR